MEDVILIKSFFVIPISLVGIGLAFWVLLSDKKAIANKLLFADINLLILSLILDYLSGFLDNSVATIFIRSSYAFLVLAAAILFYFIEHFPFESRKSKIHVIFGYLILPSAILVGAITVFSSIIVSGLEDMSWGNRVDPGGSIWLYYLYLILLICISSVNLINKYRQSSKLDKTKIKFMVIGIISYVVLQIIFNLVLTLVGIQSLYYLGDYSIIIFVAFTAYAIVKHHLFDVRLAIVRSVTYSLVLVTLAGIYVAIAFALSTIFDRSFTSPEQTFSGVAISLVLAFVFQPIRRFFDKVTNRIFYKDNYSTDDFFAILNKTLSTTTDLRGLLERVAYEIGHTLKSEQAFFFINTTEGHYISAGTQHHKQLPKSDAKQIEKTHDGSHKIILASLLESNNPTRRLMISHRIELILPLIKDGVVVGYLCLGDHLTSGYTNRDIKALNTISDELVIAIQNALAVHEIRELNSTLQQKVANATKELRSSNAVLRQLDKIKDEFISMASHQLRTPLTSVKGYISMVIEGDAGKITNSQKQLLDEAYISSERMVHLINDFLNVSRIQTGKFIIDRSSVDLSKLVGEEIDSLRPNATGRKLKFVYNPPKKFPTMELDDGKIRQVVMNYADNAIYYSHENSTITVSLSIDTQNNEALFTVKDTGIGVPINEREHLFSKFYRASNARIQRPDGTGVGIYLAKKVIDAHGGKIVFESTEGKGSTFGFRLPLQQHPK